LGFVCLPVLMIADWGWGIGGFIAFGMSGLGGFGA
jgi:hypothetical protein